MSNTHNAIRKLYSDNSDVNDTFTDNGSDTELPIIGALSRNVERHENVNRCIYAFTANP